MGAFLESFGIFIFLGLFLFLTFRGGGCRMGCGGSHHGNHPDSDQAKTEQQDHGNHKSGGCH